MCFPSYKVQKQAKLIYAVRSQESGYPQWKVGKGGDSVWKEVWGGLLERW